MRLPFDVVIAIVVILAIFASVRADRKVLLLGDSLIDYPWQRYDLVGKIKARIKSNETLTFYNAGEGGNTIDMIKARTEPSLVDNQIGISDYVILYWDSDCSDIDESSLSRGALLRVRKKYMYNVQRVISVTLSYTPYLVVAAPELLGEGPIDDPSVSCGRWPEKTSMLEDYRLMTRQITHQNNLTYIDMRRAFQAALPEGWSSCSGMVTDDGEHPNNNGTIIEATLFAEVIDNWLSSPALTTLKPYPGPDLLDENNSPITIIVAIIILVIVSVTLFIVFRYCGGSRKASDTCRKLFSAQPYHRMSVGDDNQIEVTSSH